MGSAELEGTPVEFHGENDDPQDIMAIAGLVTLAVVMLEGGSVDLNIGELDQLAGMDLNEVLEFEIVGDPETDRANAWLRVKAKLKDVGGISEGAGAPGADDSDRDSGGG